MVLSVPRTIYGVHSLTLYDRTSWVPFGIIKVVGSLNLALSGSFNDLFGGSSRFAWESEQGVLDTSLTGNIKEVPDFAFEKFLGATATATAAEASGNCGTLTNKVGTTAMSATIGVATATALAGSEANLKDALYVIKAASDTTVDIYAMTDADFDKGTDAVFFSDGLKVITTQTIVSATATNITDFGFKLTGGSGTIGMTIGDTAYVYTRKANTGSSLITVGASNATFPEFGAVIASQKKGTGDTFETQIFRCKAIGLPIAHSEAAWLGADFNMKALYDSTENAVFRSRAIKA